MIQREGNTASSHRNFYLGELLNFQLIFSLFLCGAEPSKWLVATQRKKEKKTLGRHPIYIFT